MSDKTKDSIKKANEYILKYLKQGKLPPNRYKSRFRPSSKKPERLPPSLSLIEKTPDCIFNGLGVYVIKVYDEGESITDCCILSAKYCDTLILLTTEELLLLNESFDGKAYVGRAFYRRLWDI